MEASVEWAMGPKGAGAVEDQRGSIAHCEWEVETFLSVTRSGV